MAAIAAGAYCRQAAERFVVGTASAIRWRARERLQGDARAKALGGDRRSGRIEVLADLILGWVETERDIPLGELRGRPADRGVTVGVSSLWRFFERRRISLKKGPPTSPSRIDPTS